MMKNKVKELQNIYADEARLKDYKHGYLQGMQAAAAFINEHRASANGFRLGDLLLLKFNQTKRKPRKAQKQSQQVQKRKGE